MRIILNYIAAVTGTLTFVELRNSLCLPIPRCLPGDLAGHDVDAEQAHPSDRFEADFRPLLRGR